MATETVIDALIVRLGLDPTSYKKGVADATRSQKALTDNTKKSGIEISDSLKAVTRQVALMVLGFESLKGAIGFLAGINNADAAMSRLARNTGTNVHELNQWGNAVDLLGGDAKEAQASVLGLSKELTAAKTGGDLGPMLQMFGRLGVDLVDSEGHVRTLFQMLDAMGGKLRALDQPTAFNLGAQAGLSEGVINLLLQEDAVRKKTFADAERANNMNEEAGRRAELLQKQWREMLQSAQAFGREILTTITPGIIAFLNALQPAAESLRGILKGLNDAHVGEAFATAINGVARALAYMVEKLPAAQAAVASFFEFIGPKIDYVADKVARFVELLNQAGSWFGSHVGVGQEILSDALANGAARAALRPALPGTERSPAALAQAAQARRAARFASQQGAAATGPGGTTSVQIDAIHVHTQATDAEGIARELPPALERKGVVAQANTGMN